MADETGFFRFGTNINDVVLDIERGLNRVNQSTNRQSRSGGVSGEQFAREATGVAQGFSRVQQELIAGRQRLQNELAEVSYLPANQRNGAFSRAYEQNIRDTFGRIRNVLADELGRAPQESIRGLNMRALGAQIGQDYISGLQPQLDRARRSMQLSFAQQFPGEVNPYAGLRLGRADYARATAGLNADLAANPVNYQAGTDVLAALRNRVRLEDQARNLVSRGRTPEEVERALGSSAYAFIGQGGASIRAVEGAGEGQAGFQFVPSRARQQLQEQERLASNQESTGQRLQREERAALRVAEAERQVARERENARRVLNDTLGVYERIGSTEYYRRSLAPGAGQAGPGGSQIVRLSENQGETVARPVANPSRVAALEAQYQRSINDATRRASEESAARFLAGSPQYTQQRSGSFVRYNDGVRDDIYRTIPGRDGAADRAVLATDVERRNVQGALAREIDRAQQEAIELNAALGRTDRLLADIGRHRISASVFRDSSGNFFQTGTDRATGRTTARPVTNPLDIERYQDTYRRQTASSGGGATGFLGGVTNGLGGNNEQGFLTGYGNRLASAFQFATAYGGLYALQGAISDTVKEFLDYQDSLTDLQVATEDFDNSNTKLTGTLKDLAVLSGSNGGAAFDVAASGIRAFRGTDQTEAGVLTENAVTQLSLITGKAQKDVLGDVIASATAFELDPDQFTQITDAVANAKRSIGGDSGQISQGLALISISAKEAGFNLNEAASIIALVQSRTDQSGQAIATRLTRIFQIIQGSTGKSLAREFSSLGVDANASTKDQLEAYEQIFADPGTSEAVKDRIGSALGGTANLRELLPLLKEGKTLQEAYAEASQNAGQGTDEFQRKSDNLNGLLKRISGELKRLQANLIESGLLDFFGALLTTIEPTIGAMNAFLEALTFVIEKVPGLQLVASTLLTIAATAKVLAVLSAAGVGAGALGGATAFGAGAGRAAAAGRKGTGTLAGLGGLAGAAAANPAVLIGSLVVAGGLAYAGNRINENGDFDRAELQVDASLAGVRKRLDGTGAGAEQGAVDLLAAAGNLDKTDLAGRFDDDKSRLREQLLTQGEYLRGLGERLTKEEELAQSQQNLTVFGTGAIETLGQLSTGLQRLKDNGASAGTQFFTLLEALNTPPEISSRRPFNATQFESDLARNINPLTVSAAVLPLFQSVPDNTFAQQLPGAAGSGEEIRNFLTGTGRPGGDPAAYAAGLFGDANGALNSENAAKLPEVIKQQLAKQGLGDGSGATDEQFEAATLAAVQSLDIFGGITDLYDAKTGKKGVFDDADIATAEANLVKSIETRRKTADTSILGGLGLNGTGTLTRDQMLSLLNDSPTGPNGEAGPNLIQRAEDRYSLLGASQQTSGNKANVDKKALQELRAFASRQESGSEEIEGLTILLDNIKTSFLQNTVEELEGFRGAAESRAKTDGELRKIRLRYAKQEVDVAGNNEVVLRAIFDTLDEQTARSILRYIREQIAVQRDVVRRERRLYAIAVANAPSVRRGAGRSGEPDLGNVFKLLPDDKALRGASKRLRALVEKLNTLNEIFDSTAFQSPTAELGGETAADRFVAQAQANAARVGGGIQGARFQLSAAQKTLDTAKKGTVDYYNALAGLYQAQYALSDAITAGYAATLGLQGDITDPVEQARDALKVAQKKVSELQRLGASPDLIDAAKLDARTSETALEQARFQQRLGDMQTAEQLGRITAGQYLAYLQREHDRLERIKGRTRQQQDQLNTIDLAIKEANSALDAQFNFGDINLRGIVYQARRYAAEQAASFKQRSATADAAQFAGATSGSSDNSVRIYIDGADTAKVKRIVEDVVGRGARTRTSAPRRR